LCQFNGAVFELTVCEKGCCVITVIDGDEVIESSPIKLQLKLSSPLYAIDTQILVLYFWHSK
jgi:hypothetical protein